jgi:hypothetical protein
MKRLVTTGLLLTGLTIFLAVAAVEANPLWVGYFELMDQPYAVTIPAAGSEWRATCASFEAGGGGWSVLQADYEDNADAVVSPGDVILGPMGMGRDQITVASATRLYRLEGTDRVFRPQLEIPGGPVGETWEILYPDSEWGTTVIVADYVDFAPPGPSPGDDVLLDGSWVEIIQVGLSVEGTHAVPVETTTWGKIKAFFGRVF